MKSNHNDDLAHLAELGRQVMTPADLNIDLLRRRLKYRYINVRHWSGTLFSLLIGAAGGLGIFFLFFNNTKREIRAEQKTPQILEQAEPIKENEIVSDTVTIKPENFILAKSKLVPSQDAGDTAWMDEGTISSISPDLSSVLKRGLSEEKLKYIVNSPVFYINDMKVTEYTTLYFRNQKFVDLGGTPASVMKKNAGPASTPVLPVGKPVYLHEELSTAMKEFKEGNYQRCLYLLGNVGTYNKADLNCSFYSAMCHFYLGHFEESLTLLNVCLASSNNCFLEESLYYKGRALNALGKTTEAQTIFRSISEIDGFYTDKARSYLK